MLQTIFHPDSYTWLNYKLYFISVAFVIAYFFQLQNSKNTEVKYAINSSKLFLKWKP